MKIKINKTDIFNYVVGNSNYDPIEKIIDPLLYEVFDVSILDIKKKEFFGQNDKYKNFCSQVSRLRKNAPNMNRSEVMKICTELEEIAPTEINLSEPLVYPLV